LALPKGTDSIFVFLESILIQIISSNHLLFYPLNMENTLKRAVHGFATFAMVAGSVSFAPIATADQTCVDFADVPVGNEFNVYVCDLFNEGVIGGVVQSDGSRLFEPGRFVSRGETAKMIFLSLNAAGLSMPINTTGGPHFSDVTTSNPFYSYIETLFNEGVISGYGDGNFGPNNPVKRSEFSKMTQKGYQIPIDLTGAPHFPDVPADYWAHQFVETLKNNNIISGYANGMFGPENYILRQESAKMIDRTMTIAKTTGFNSGTGARLDLQANTREIAGDCNSMVGLTTTVYDALGNVDESFSDNVTLETTLGEFATSGTSTVTKKAGTGRATFSLSSCTAGSANIMADTPAYSPITVEVRFIEGAQGPNEGKGSACVTGTGCMDLLVYNEVLSSGGDANTHTISELIPIVGGWATVEAYLYDSNGDPLDNGDIRCTLITGTGFLQVGATPPGPPALPNPTEARSIQLTFEDNGRYIGNYAVVNGQNESPAKIECSELNSSPNLTATVEAQMKYPVVKTWVADSTLTTVPVIAPVEAVGNNMQNTTALLATITDQFGDPRTLTCLQANNPMTLRAQVTSGPSDVVISSHLAGTLGVLDPVTLAATSIAEGDNLYLQGLWAATFLAGPGPGTATVEVRANDCISQPRATTTVNISEPKLDLFASSMGIGGAAGQDSWIFARFTDINGKGLPGENLTWVIENGPAGIDWAAAYVDHGNGFYSRQLTSPAVVSTSQSVKIRVTATDRVGTGNGPVDKTITLNASPSNGESVVATNMTLIPLRTTVGTNQMTPVLVILRDARQNGVDLACNNILGANVVVGNAWIDGAPPPAGLPGVMVGDGACFYSFDTQESIGNMRMQVKYQDPGPPTSTLLSQEVSFSVKDNSIAVEAVNNRLTIGDGSGVIAYPRDEVGDSVNGLNGATGGDFIVVTSDTRVVTSEDNGSNVYGELGLPGAVPNGTYATAFYLPEDIAISSFQHRTTLTSDGVAPVGAVTNPTDSVSINAAPVTVDVKAYPNGVISGDCLLLETRLAGASGVPYTIRTGVADGLTVEIASSTGANGTLTAGNAGCAAGVNRLEDVLDNADTIDRDGIFIVTYQASGIATHDTIRSYLPNAATTPEATVSVTTR
jgi:hypothetical protein